MSKQSDAIYRVLKKGESELEVCRALDIKAEKLAAWLKQTEVIEYVRAGNTQSEAAQHFNIPPQTVSRWIRVDGHPKNHRVENTGSNPPNEYRFAGIVFGAVLSRLRDEKSIQEGKKLTTDDFAPRLKISSSTLRNLESAQKSAPQATLAYPLSSECGLNLAMTLMVIGFVRAFDESESFEESQEIAKRLRLCDPRIAFLVDHLFIAVNLAAKERTTYLKKNDGLIDDLISLMRARSSQSSAVSGNTRAFLDQLSPVLLDAVMALSDKLQHFNPAMDQTSLALWEKANSHRIRRVFAFYNEPSVLLNSIDNFECHFLRYSTATVKYFIVLNSASKDDAITIKSKIINKFSNLDNRSIVIHILEQDSSYLTAFSQLLHYDVYGSRLIDYSSNRNVPGIVKMTTINLYELGLDRNDRRDYEQLHCGFVDNSTLDKNIKKNNLDDTIFFTRALHRPDVERIFNLFNKVAENF